MLKLRSHLTDNQGAVKPNSSGLTSCDGQHKTLFERLGGQPAIDALVEGMYGRIFQDPQLDHYFLNADKDKVKAR
jgi:hemoglobin